jgi:Fe-S-cluster containining protein
MKFVCNQCGCCCRHLNRSEIYNDLNRGDGVCIYLQGNLCSIYETRPLKCRVDACYDHFFFDKMSREQFYKINKQACALLQKQQEQKQQE